MTLPTSGLLAAADQLLSGHTPQGAAHTLPLGSEPGPRQSCSGSLWTRRSTSSGRA